MTVADDRNHDRLIANRRWIVVCKLIANRQAPPGATPDDYQWEPDSATLADPKA